ncbi:hypothetical protein [Bacillus sp. 1P06AnD]|uniref:hypothetical protein n=1 Tax=Bacillus sp. 1P06AnD TaxID=3132208 RepID=UPI0039A2F5E7
MEDMKKSLDKGFVPENSSMASDMEEVQELGKQMDRMETGQELKKEHDLYSDPVQSMKAE